MSHKVKTHNWFLGLLRTREYNFDSFESALSFAVNNEFHAVKIYNDNGDLVHELSKGVPVNTYA